VHLCHGNRFRLIVDGGEATASHGSPVGAKGAATVPTVATLNLLAVYDGQRETATFSWQFLISTVMILFTSSAAPMEPLCHRPRLRLPEGKSKRGDIASHGKIAYDKFQKR